MMKKACEEILLSAKTFQLPKQFLLRLIWQESHFNPQAVSHAGAMGIAQFMPGTAQWRGLDDPFDFSLSIQHSGRWLGELRQQFGNLGLAAAAYNAGPGRVQDWLAGTRELPAETRDYVRIITGRNADDWVGMRDGSDAAAPTSAEMECPPRGGVAAFRAEPDAGASGEAKARPLPPALRDRRFARQFAPGRCNWSATVQNRPPFSNMPACASSFRRYWGHARLKSCRDGLADGRRPSGIRSASPRRPAKAQRRSVPA